MKYKIAVSGAAETDHCAQEAKVKITQLGQEIVRQGAVLVTGATSGAPFWAAQGAKEQGGFSIGLSPAASLVSHVKSYRLPIDNFDLIIFTGFDYSGRNLLMTRSADAIVVCCGRMGTLNEFTIAFEDRKPIGILTGTGGITDEIEHIIEKAHKGKGRVIYDSDPKVLVSKLIALIEEEQRAAFSGEAVPEIEAGKLEPLVKTE